MKPLHESRWALAVFCALAAVAVYLNSLTNGFALDDVFIVQTNERVHDLAGIRDIWLTPYWPFMGRELGLYRPGTIFLFAIQWAAGDGAAWVFHAVSILLHAGATLLVFRLLERLSGVVPAFSGALLFAVHPVHTEAVANVVGQAEITGAVLVFAACLIHVSRAQASVSWPRRIALILIYAAALMTKESTVVLPALLVIVDLARRRHGQGKRDFAAWAEAMLMPLLLLASTLAFYLLLRYDVMGGAITGVDAAPSLPYLREEYRVLNALRAFPELIRLLILPMDLSADYMPGVLLPVEDVRPLVVLGAGLLVALTLLAAATPWKPTIGMPAAWFLVSILTVSNLFFPIGVLVAERTLYLPSFALSAAVAFAWERAQRHGAGRRVLAAALLAGVVTVFSIRTWIRNPDWKDTTAMLAAFVRDHPESYRAQWSLAAGYRAGGDYPRAEVHYRIAEEIYDRDAEFLNEYAEFLMSLGRFDEAVPLLEKSAETRAHRAGTQIALAGAYLASGRYAEALAVARDAERNEAPRASAAFIRAAASEGLARYDDAAAAWRVGISHSDNVTWRMWSFLARTLARAGRDTSARSALARARDMTSDSTALQSIYGVEQAIAQGCYRTPQVCDGLGRWMGFVPVTPVPPGSR